MASGMIQAWLESLNLGQYFGQFLEHNIETMEQCSVLDDQALQEIGVSLAGHRKRILNHLPTVDQDVYVNENLVAEKLINMPSISPTDLRSRMGDSLYLSNSDTSLSSIEGVVHSQSSREASPTTFQANSDSLVRPVPKPRIKAKRPMPKPRTSARLGRESVKIEGATESVSTTDDTQDLSSSDLCGNRSGGEESSQNFQSKNSGKTKASQSNETKCIGISKPLRKDPPYVNVVKGSNNQVVIVEEANTTGDITDEILEDRESSIYEPIWDDKSSSTPVSQEKIPPAGNIRTSVLLDSSPLKPKRVDSVILSLLNVDDVDKRRYSSVSFDIPPPEFPPPPLPSDISRADLLADFDPLCGPPIPPRPDNQAKKTVQKYENFSLNSSHFAQAESQTLPPTVNEEPGTDEDMFFREMRSSLRSRANFSTNVFKDPFQINDPFQNSELSINSDPFQNTNPFQSSDPFHRSDPFGSFKADDYQDFEMKVKYSLAHKTIDHQPEPHRKSYSEDPVYEDPIYEDPGPPPQKGIDPIGLKKSADSHSFVKQSTSSSSSNQSLRLSQVMPAPNFRETVLSDDSSGVYSIAGELVDSDESGESIDDTGERLPNGPTATVVPVIRTEQVVPPRKKERSGWLYKQGGVKANRGWRKRWVIFNGRDLRYYADNKTQVSKRIVPLSIMKEVTQEIYSLNSSQQTGAKLYKFLLKTKNRTFHFATDDSNDCMLWTSTIMQAIIEYKPPPDGDKEGGDMHDPDLQEWIKFDGRSNKYLVAIKNQRLCCYNSGEDFKLATPIHDIEMKLAAVKEIDKTKLQLSTHYCHFMLQFERSHDALKWRMAIEEAIADALGDNKVLNEVTENEYNKKCADCDAPNPHWSSINLGIVLCKKCAGIHREFQSSVSKVRSLRMDTSVWTRSLIEILKVIGNKNANDFWASKTTPRDRINENSLPELRQKFIHQKYREKKFCNLHPFSQDKDSLNTVLLYNVTTDDVLTTMKILFSGADVKYADPSDPNLTVLEVARAAKQNLQAEFLLQNGGDRTHNSLLGGGHEARLARMKISHQGYLCKTGPNMKDFLRRWCVVEHGCISYFLDEKSTVFKDRVDSEFLLCIQNNNKDRLKTAFEVSTKKQNRVYLFKADSEKEKLSWMQVFIQLFCPVELMETMKTRNFTLAGIFHMKHGLNMEWQRTWLVIDGRTLFYTQQDVTGIEEEEADLRKMTSLKKITDKSGSCKLCLESGPQLVVSNPQGMALYIQADLVRDTERLLASLDIAMKYGGDSLDDQPLTSDDVPVLVQHCIDLIELRALNMRGIYREGSVNSHIQIMLDRFKEDARSVALTDETDVHIIANVVKRFFRNLDDPLLTSDLYKHFIQTAGLGDPVVKDQWYKYLLQQLPRVNYQTLKRLAIHLWRLSRHSSENMMTLDNIAIAFGSTLMKSNKEENQPMPTIGRGVQLEMQVISHIVSNYQRLFDVAEEHQTVVEKISEAQKEIKKIGTTNIPVSVEKVDSMLIAVHYLHQSGNSESIHGEENNLSMKISDKTTVEEVVKMMRSKLNLQSGCWYLHEVLCNGTMERPLHPKQSVMSVLKTWWSWDETHSSRASLCLKNRDLVDSITQNYNPGQPLFSEFKFTEDSKTKKYAFEFSQFRLSYYKDIRRANRMDSWNIEEIIVYKGADSFKRKAPSDFKFPFSFFQKEEKFGNKDPLGRTVWCSSEAELYKWMAAMIMAQYPDGWS